MFLRRLWPTGHATNRNLVTLDICIPIGTTGAVGTIVGKGATATRTGAGAYTITPTGIQTGVGAVLFASATVISTNKSVAYVTSRTLATGVVTVVTADAGAPDTAADVDSGSLLCVRIVYRNSSSDRS